MPREPFFHEASDTVRFWVQVDDLLVGASIGENWCSEFYSWVVDPYVKWSYYGPPADIKGITDGFNLFSGLLNPVFAPGVASSGDYLGLDTDGDGIPDSWEKAHRGVVNHSAMVLDWDKSIGQFWTIEGNLNNAVVIRMRTESQVKVFGIITKSMFE
mgnify:CR=1 FL=1